MLLRLNKHFHKKTLKLKCNAHLSVTKKQFLIVLKRHGHNDGMISNLSCQIASIVCFLKTKHASDNWFHLFLSLVPSISDSAVKSTSWKNANCPFSRCFHFTRPRWLVKPTISSLKLYHISHVVIEKSFLSERVKSGIRSVSKNVPRIIEKLAKTNTRGKSCHRLLNQVTALCYVPSPLLTHSLAFPLLSLSLTAIKYFIIT